MIIAVVTIRVARLHLTNIKLLENVYSKSQVLFFPFLSFGLLTCATRVIIFIYMSLADTGHHWDNIARDIIE